MIIDMSNVKTTSFLGKGKHLVKIYTIKETKDEFNNDVLKITFKDKNDFIFTDYFPLTEKMLWKLGNLAKAVKVWDDGIDKLDTNQLLNKYLFITIAPYKKKNGEEVLTIKKFEYSKANEKIQSNTNEAIKQNQPQQIPTVDIDEDEIPF